MRPSRVGAPVVGAVLLASVCFAANPGMPATWAAFLLDGQEYTVNSASDATDADLGDQTCATSAGECTLRAAIQQANAEPGLDQINVPAGTFTLSLQGATEDLSATGDLDIVDDVDLVGAGSALTTISAAGLGDRVLDVVSSHDGTVSIQGIGLTGGNTTVSGGGLFHRDGALSLSDIALVGNRANEGGGLAFFGGGGDVLTIDGLTAVDNVSTRFGGGLSLGASAGSSSRITDAVISSNDASEGGGIAIGTGDSPLGPDAIVIENTRIVGNDAAVHGGGLLGDSFTLRDVVVDDNETTCFGGGIRANKDFVLERVAVTNNRSTGPSCRGAGVSQNGNGVLTATNVTISNNSGNAPSGLYIELPPGLAGGHHQLTNLTITGNNGGLYTAPVAAGNPAAPTARNVIVANNAGYNCGNRISISLGNNIDDGSTCGFDVPNTNPLLGPLVDLNDTKVHVPAAGSPAIDAVDVGEPCPSVDQRGQARPIDGDGDGQAECDSGSYEAGPAPVPTPTPTPVATPTPTPTPTPVATPTPTPTPTPVATPTPTPTPTPVATPTPTPTPTPVATPTPTPTPTPVATPTPTPTPSAANLTVSMDAVSLAGTAISATGLGDDYRYRATIRNSGPGTATGVQLQEVINLEHNIVAAPPGCVLPAVAPTGARFGTVTCAIAPLAPGANAVVDITVEGRLTCTRWGNSANNSITGTATGDVLCGGGGADTITGLGRADTIYGFGPTGSVSATASVTWAGGGPVSDGAAVAIGTVGSDAGDTINGGAGNDTIHGGNGNDTIDGDANNDTIDGGDGRDFLSGSAGNDDLFGGLGADRLEGNSGDDELFGDVGTNRDATSGSSDVLSGGGDEDRLFGQGGRDTMEGGGQIDFLHGGIDNDELHGGPEGGNTLNGASGNDICSLGPPPLGDIRINCERTS